MPVLSARSAWASLCILLALAALLAVPTAANAESECISDATGDVENRNENALEAFGPADIEAVCYDHGPELLEVTVRVTDPTDPATDSGWDDFASTVGLAIDAASDNSIDFEVNYARFPDGIQTNVFDSNLDAQACTAEGSFDGVRYRMRIPNDCLGNPAEVRVAAYFYYASDNMDQDNVGYYDEVPTRPNFNGPYGTQADPATAVQRIAGPSRVDTAIAVSRDDFADGAAGAVVLARADLFPDALVAAPLAKAVNGPLLLTPSFAVAQVVEDEIQRVLPAGGTVYLSGGTAALEQGVADEITALGYNVVRAAGSSRYATAVEVARSSNANPALIVVANGNDFPDALVGGSLAASEDGVEILTNGNQLEQTATDYLAEHPDAEIVAIGSVAAEAVPSATAIVGDSPFQTSVAVANARYPDANGAAIASGTNFPDGLTGGAHAGRRGIPLLLSTPDVLSQNVDAYLLDRAPLSNIYLYGGTVALSYQVEAEAANNLG